MKTRRFRGAEPAIDRSKLGLIHLAKTRLGMEDDSYRAMLLRVAGVRSAKALDVAGFDIVMAEFRRLGFASTAFTNQRADATRDPDHATSAQVAKIRKLWSAYKRAEDETGLRRWLAGHFGISDVRFLSRSKAQKVIGALSSFEKPKEGG